MRFLLCLIIVFLGLLVPTDSHAEISVNDIMNIYGVSQPVAEEVVNTVGGMFANSPNLDNLASTTNPMAPYDPVEGDLGRGLKAREAADLSNVGYGASVGKGGAMIGLAVALQFQGMQVSTSGITMDPTKVEASQVIQQMGQREFEQAAHMRSADSKNYAQHRLLNGDFGQSGGSVNVNFKNGATPGAGQQPDPQGTLPDLSVGAKGILGGMGVDASAVQQLLSQGNVSGAVSLVEDAVKTSSIKINPNASAGSVGRSFMEQIGFGDNGEEYSVADSSDVPGVPLEESKAEAPLGVFYGANQDNSGVFDRAVRQAQDSPQSIEFDEGEEYTKLEVEQVNEQEELKRLRFRNRLRSARNRFDLKKLHNIGIVRPMPGSTIFDVARDTYKSWNRYRSELYLARK